MKQVMKRIRRIVNAGSTVWSEHHVSKEAKVSRGSTAIPASLDMEFKVKVNDQREITLEATKNRIAPFESIIVVPKFDDSGWRVEYKQTKDQDVWDKVSEVLTDEPTPVSIIMQKLSKKIQTNETTVRGILFKQVEGSLIKTEIIKIDLLCEDGITRKRKVAHYWKV
jgi:hypothetical protein